MDHPHAPRGRDLNQSETRNVSIFSANFFLVSHAGNGSAHTDSVRFCHFGFNRPNTAEWWKLPNFVSGVHWQNLGFVLSFSSSATLYIYACKESPVMNGHYVLRGCRAGQRHAVGVHDITPTDLLGVWSKWVTGLPGDTMIKCVMEVLSNTLVNLKELSVCNKFVLKLDGIKHIHTRRTHACAHAHTHALTHARTHSLTLALTHAHTHAHTPAHTHRHPHTRTYWLILLRGKDWLKGKKNYTHNRRETTVESPIVFSSKRHFGVRENPHAHYTVSQTFFLLLPKLPGFLLFKK